MVRRQLPWCLRDRVGGHRPDRVAHQLCVTRRLDHHGDGVGDPVDLDHRRFDLGELDAQPAQLHLEIRAADVFEFTVATPTDHVAGAVHALPRRRGDVGDEAVGGQVGTTDVGACELHTREVELTGHRRGDRSQAVVEHVDPGVGHRPPDGHRVGVPRCTRDRSRRPRPRSGRTGCGSRHPRRSTSSRRPSAGAPRHWRTPGAPCAVRARASTHRHRPSRSRTPTSSTARNAVS